MSTAMDLLSQVTGCSAMWWPASLKKDVSLIMTRQLTIFTAWYAVIVQFGASYSVWHVLEVENSTLPNGKFE